MNIEARKGHMVRYIGATDDQVRWGVHDDPRDHLTIGETYLVDHTEIHSWHTKVYLQDADGGFPSVAFKDA